MLALPHGQRFNEAGEAYSNDAGQPFLQADGHRDDSHQYYKSAAVKLKHAIEHINAAKDSLDFVLTLGDCIDGNCTLQATAQDLEVVASEFDRCVRYTPQLVHAVNSVLECESADRQNLTLFVLSRCH